MSKKPYKVEQYHTIEFEMDGVWYEVEMVALLTKVDPDPDTWASDGDYYGYEILESCEALEAVAYDLEGEELGRWVDTRIPPNVAQAACEELEELF